MFTVEDNMITSSEQLQTTNTPLRGGKTTRNQNIFKYKIKLCIWQMFLQKILLRWIVFFLFTFSI